jgi:hypothetical protein
MMMMMMMMMCVFITVVPITKANDDVVSDNGDPLNGIIYTENAVTPLLVREAH